VATDFEGLIPVSVAEELIAAAERQSVVMQLGNVQRMPSGIESVPIVTVEPDAEWNALGGRKKATSIEWSALRLEAEELACVLAIPQAWVDDAGFPVWEQVRNRVAAAFARRIDETLLFAVAPVPASFPAGGVVAAAGAAVSGADALEAIDKALAKVEGEGLMPNGVASSPAIGTALRQEYRAIASLPSTAPTAEVYGLPVAIAAFWDSAAGDAIVGDSTKLVVAVREDIRFETSDSAIIQDAAGAITANAFQGRPRRDALLHAHGRGDRPSGRCGRLAGRPVRDRRLVGRRGVVGALERRHAGGRRAFGKVREAMSDRFDDDGLELGDATSEQTMLEMEELALRRAASTGHPVIVAGFSSSGRAHVTDVDLPDGAPLAEAGLVEVGDVTITRSPPAAYSFGGASTRSMTRSVASTAIARRHVRRIATASSSCQSWRIAFRG